MSEMLDDIFTKNFMKLNLDDGLLPAQTQPKVPGQSRLNRSASYFSPPSPPESSSHSLSSEHVNNDDNGSPFWSSNIWSQGPVSKPKQLPFRPDRSMSLTESSSSLLSSFGQLKNHEAFPSVPATTTVAPPPGFPPSSPFPAQIPPMLSSNRYKTELCRGFQETGSCKYGSKCQFAHGEAELRGLYRHPKYKTEPCRTFYNFGYCPYGSRCHFIHEEKISGGPLASANFPNQRQPTPTAPSAQNPRHQLRQSVSFAGFLGSSRSSSPPSFPSSFNDLNVGFSRAPSVSPPPADLLSPVFVDSLQREAAAFQFGNHQTRASAGDIHNIPLILEPKASRCVCGHGNNFNSNNSKVFTSMEEEDRHHHQDSSKLFPGTGGHGAFMKPAGLQRFSSEDSLEDSYSSSSGGSSGSESPTFDGSATKRLTVFERLSLSD
ncbi:mRNA decay activator protein ZFP36L1-like [Seriola lalandi dorsalis]|uniref:mRNA decay activator protein ZFP36 n=1 Tax=Seriola lalandi dorsalis TaxID=1841481 RepID=A0A3B4X4N6_SERLL|nr:mRNA decay activator protein ZFP36L1-like [Seriola lalandi dorsalis]XP_056230354.1 mRNA decay activator protein ZFP36L1 [Seriola aureovittata]